MFDGTACLVQLSAALQRAQSGQGRQFLWLPKSEMAKSCVAYEARHTKIEREQRKNMWSKQFKENVFFIAQSANVLKVSVQHREAQIERMRSRLTQGNIYVKLVSP